ncbi:MAG TPA: GNAT family N-acetyltransferase [Fimbriimonadaceae bacterium]|nr:GNAT family N-acetyltransferase [Fimbriimonadaceae bacterium]
MDLFATARLRVRRLESADAEAMLGIYGDKETMRFVGDGRPFDIDGCRFWIEATDRNFARRGYGMMAAADRETGELIGCVGICHPGLQEEPELKYAIRRDRWGKGLATELALGALHYAQTKLGLRRLIARVYAANTRSQAVLRKAGFDYVSTRRHLDGSLIQVWAVEASRPPIHPAAENELNTVTA